MPQECKLTFKKSIRAADNEIQTRFFYNSGCRNLISLHDKLKSKRKTCNYVKIEGEISTVIRHKKGKSSTLKIQKVENVGVRCTKRFASLANISDSHAVECHDIGNSSKYFNKKNRFVGASIKPKNKK